MITRFVRRERTYAIWSCYRAGWPVKESRRMQKEVHGDICWAYSFCIVDSDSYNHASAVRIAWLLQSHPWLPPFPRCYESVQTWKVPGCQQEKRCDAGAWLGARECGLQKPGLLPKSCVCNHRLWSDSIKILVGVLTACSCLCITAHYPLGCANNHLHSHAINPVRES